MYRNCGEDIEYLSEYRIYVSQSALVTVYLDNFSQIIQVRSWCEGNNGENRHSLEYIEDPASSHQLRYFQGGIIKSVLVWADDWYFLMIFWYLDICSTRQGTPLDKTLLRCPALRSATKCEDILTSHKLAVTTDRQTAAKVGVWVHLRVQGQCAVWGVTGSRLPLFKN